MKRLPRRVKKQLKKFPEKWQEYVIKKREFQTREEHLDTIFQGDYSNGGKIIRKMFKK